MENAHSMITTVTGKNQITIPASKSFDCPANIEFQSMSWSCSRSCRRWNPRQVALWTAAGIAALRVEREFSSTGGSPRQARIQHLTPTMDCEPNTGQLGRLFAQMIDAAASIICASGSAGKRIILW
jgi:hypothetical protein